MATKSTEEVKKRNWWFVLYPDSAPSDWKERLQKSGLPIAISPLHDSDKNPTGEPKKPHHHIILCWPGPTPYSNVEALTSGLNQPHPQFLESVKGAYRYFTHKDNPEKFPYNECDIQLLNGFDESDYDKLSAAQVREKQREIVAMIRQYHLVEYSELMNFLEDNGRLDLWDVAADHTLFFTHYLKSVFFVRQNGGKTE